jgi:tRNA nucleotidyltransferase (CCA-adding enzyme)
MSIQDDIREMHALTVELKRLKAETGVLRCQLGRCEQRIQEFLEVNGHPGVKYKELTVVAQPRKRRQYVSKKERMERARQFFQHQGAPVSSSDLERFFESLRGTYDVQTRIQLHEVPS